MEPFSSNEFLKEQIFVLVISVYSAWWGRRQGYSFFFIAIVSLLAGPAITIGLLALLPSRVTEQERHSIKAEIDSQLAEKKAIFQGHGNSLKQTGQWIGLTINDLPTISDNSTCPRG